MKTEKRYSRYVVLVMACLAALPARTAAQDAADLMRRAVAAQAQRLANVENVTIVQEVMGMEMSMYMEKRDVGGTPTLMPVSVTMGSMTNPVPEDMAQGDWANPFQEAWINRTRLTGTEDVGGRSAYVFVMDDFTGLELPGMPAGSQGAQDFRPISVEYALDQEDLVPLRVVLDGEATRPDGTQSPVKMTMFMEDYREVEGYLHPFTTRAVTEGMAEAADIDRDQLQAQLDQIRAQLENMPEAQRSMMEGMMQAQIDRLEGMLGEGGTMEMTITVKDLRVNGGPPGGGF